MYSVLMGFDGCPQQGLLLGWVDVQVCTHGLYHAGRDVTVGL